MGKSSAIRYDQILCRRLADHAIKNTDFQGTIQQIAELFGCSERTVSAWKGKHPEFKELCEEIASSIDTPVENALYRLAIGFEHDETERFYDVNGEQIRAKTTTKYYPPNYQAIQLWLSNRKPDKFKVRRDTTTNSTANVTLTTDEKADAELAEILADAESISQS